MVRVDIGVWDRVKMQKRKKEKKVGIDNKHAAGIHKKVLSQ
jgi:predicted metal-dependent TIM-barrel fold hydrolase